MLTGPEIERCKFELLRGQLTVVKTWKELKAEMQCAVPHQTKSLSALKHMFLNNIGDLAHIKNFSTFLYQYKGKYDPQP